MKPIRRPSIYTRSNVPVRYAWVLWNFECSNVHHASVS